MKKVLVLMTALLAVPAFGAMTITVADDVGSTGGGAFLVTVTGDPIYGHATSSTFQTFCMETSEALNFGLTYEIALSNAAIYNNGGNSNSDPLDVRTAWVYTQWLNNSISHTVANADMVQRAIWFIENEVGGVNNALVAAAGAATTGSNPWVNNTVKVMNVFTNGQVGVYDARKQDLLVAVPAPGALILGSLGMGLVGWLRRRQAV